CAGGTVKCGGKCVDAQLDPANCGSCGNACGQDAVCSGGACQLQCGGGTTKCGGKCVDVQLDPANCGSCGKACGQGDVCSLGACQLQCTGGTTKCGNGCVNLQLDPANCGSCGKACAGGEICTSGACQLQCAGGTSKCGGKCADLQIDPANCGSCGKACGKDEQCAAGVCLVHCDPPKTVCNNLCADTQSDAKNCGKCNNACAQKEICSQGLCTSPASCKQILDGGKSQGDGVYKIDPNGGDPGDAFDVYCDMTTDGGGWTLCLNSVAGSKAPGTAITTNAGSVAFGSGHQRNCKALAVDKPAEIRHLIVNGGAVFNAQYTGTYLATPSLGGWKPAAKPRPGEAHNDMEAGCGFTGCHMGRSYDCGGSCCAGYGPEWYYCGCWALHPSNQGGGYCTTGPACSGPNKCIERYSIFVR
ncbi:MAG: hypothetical protein HY744_08980, partial [Deltaproteobacteria bacterium]|nr:hypothetical protein [Deltaproteobacteria bacterium]